MDNEKRLSINFGMNLCNYEKLNDSFTKAKCYILALGKNRNKSFFGKNAVEKAYPSLQFIPVVGHLMTTEDGKHYLGGHDYKLNVDTLELESQCVPFGVTIPSATPTYEAVVEGDEVATYLTTDVILWTGRYPKLKEAIYSEDVMFGQSMEIILDDIKPLEEDNSYTDITSFSFDALCLLNKSDDSKFNVEPCFPNASVVSTDYSAIKVEFNSMFEEMKNELKLYFTSLGGNDLGKETNVDDSNTVMTFAATYGKKRGALCSLLESMNKVDKDVSGNTISETHYWLNDFADSYAIVEKTVYTYENGDYSSTNWKIGYEYDDLGNAAKFTGDAVEVTLEWLTADDKKALADAEAKKEEELVASFKSVIEEMTSEYNTLEADFEAQKTDNETLNVEVSELKEYKLTRESEDRANGEKAIFDEFDGKLGNIEAYISLKSNTDALKDMSLDDIREKCFAIVGRYQLAKPAEEAEHEEKLTFARLMIDGTSQFDDVETIRPAYGGIVEEYRAKKNKQ